MEIYLLKSAACLALLMLFYKLFLEQQKMHVFKRFYLPGAVIFSFIIPLITLTTYVEPNPEVAFLFEPAGSEALKSGQNFYSLPLLLWSIYAAGVIFFGWRFFKNLNSLLLKIKRNPKLRNEQTVKVLLQEDVAPHTFWDYIFLNKKRFEEKTIPQEVFEHEQAHAVQKHSLDVLFMELLQVFLWFNPLLYLVRSAVKLNHEFLADEAVIKKGADRAAYQKTLLSFSSKDLQCNLVNPINYSIIKKRFTVMKTKTSKKAILARTFLLLPVLAFLVFSFSTKEVVAQTTEKDSESQVSQEKVTPEMIKEYNKLARHFKEVGITEENVDSDEFKRMKYIFSLMTPEQRKAVESFPPPPPPTVVTGHPAPDAPPVPQKENLQPVPPPVEVTGYPAPPPPPPVIEHDDAQVPPPPPPPSPIEAVEKWIEEGAKFFYNGKAISGQKALEVVQKNGRKNLNVQVEENRSGKTVKLSDRER